MAQDQRRTILDEYFELYDRDDDERAATLRTEYSALLPEKRISRCPITGEIVTMAIDTFGIDGLWWDYNDPVRPAADVPETQIAFTGALKFEGEIEVAPFTCKPGPEVPYVVPRLIRNSLVRAVISQIKIGTHIGYPIVYFSNSPSKGVARFNDWGTDRYWVYDGEGGWWDSVVEETESIDFDLGRWIESGRLMWIAPDDPKLTLRSGASGCPYLSITGRRSFFQTQDGQIWEPDLV